MDSTPRNTPVQAHPSSVDAYIRAGWSLVTMPSGSKGPNHPGWNEQENCITRAADLPANANYGLAHAYSGTMALDIDDWERAKTALTEHGIDLDALYNAPDAVTIESGRDGHGKLIYAMPFGLVLPTKKITTQINGVNQTTYELRCGTKDGLTVQDVLPPSIHPVTCQPYRWGGKGHWSRLPEVPQALLKIWTDLLDEDKQRNIPLPTEIDTSWDEIRMALGHIPPDIDRDAWVNIGMALHFAGTVTGQLDQGFNLWNEWSSKSTEKYQGVDDLWTSWRGFKPDGGVTLGTLFKIAKDHGWRRPQPSVEEIFGPQEVKAASQLIDATAGTRAPLPTIDLDMFPPILAQRADEISTGVGCDPLVPLFAGLAAAAGAADARIQLQLMPGYKVPPILWICVVGKPADKKSPATLPMNTILRDLEREDIPHYKRRKLIWDAKRAQYTAAYDAYIAHAASGEAELSGEIDNPPNMPELPPEPVTKRLMVDDITSQKLAYVVADRPYGVICWMDEMRGWLERITSARSSDDRSTWVKAYGGGHVPVDRVSAGTIQVENLAVSIFGNMQPSVFREFSHKIGKDGTIQRFIPAILDAKKSRLNHPVPDEFTSKKIWEQAIRTIHSLPPMTYTLSPEAYKVFRAFQVWYYETKGFEELLDSGDDSQDMYMTAFGKMEGQCGRLALVMHLIEQPLALEVSGDLMQRAVNICKGYVIPALRYMLGEVTGLLEDSIESWVTQHILQIAGIQQTVTLREIKRAARRKIAKLSAMQTNHQNNLIIDAMTWLQQCGWVQLTDSTPTRSHYEWTINPLLMEQYREQRKEIIKAKQARLDHVMEGINQKFGKAYPRRFVQGYTGD